MVARRIQWVVALVLVALPIFGGAEARAAATVTVDINSDTVNSVDGHCSLREAITAANTNTKSGPVPGECPDGLTGGTIRLTDDPVNGGTYALTGGELHITQPVTITGTASHPTVASTGSSRVFEVDSSATASISGLEIAGGKAAYGGGIFNQGDLTLSDDTLEDNATQDGPVLGSYGFPGGQGGGLENLGTASLTHVVVQNNTTGIGGNGSGAGGSGGPGGGIYNGGTMTLTDSQVTGNTTGAGGAGGFGGDGGVGGGIANVGTLTATGDTIDQNSTGKGGVAQGTSGGMGGQGGGILASGTTTITDSSISSNHTGDGGGSEPAGQNGAAGPGAGISSDYTHGIASAVNSLSVTDTTIANNARGAGADSIWVGSGIHIVTPEPATISLARTAVTGSDGVGIAVWAVGAADPGAVGLSLSNVTVANSGTAGLYLTSEYGGGIHPFNVHIGFSTIADNGGHAIQTSSQDTHAPAPTVTVTDSIVAANQACSGTITDGGHNLSFGNASCPGTVADPKLGTLGNHGGPTETIPLLAGSPAIDAIPASDSACTGMDQRGSPRPGGSACDIGAFEVAAPRVANAAASSTRQTGGRVTAQVTPVGLATTVTVRFGKTSAYGSSASGSTIPAGAGTTAVSVPLSGLTAGTTYHAQLVATNAEGTTSSEDLTFTTNRPPPPAQPRLSGLSISPGTFPAAAGRGGSIARARPRGATVRYSDSVAATTTFTVQRLLAGHRNAQGKCSTRPVRKGSHARKCTLVVTLRGSFSRRDTAGKNSFHFTGRLRQARLSPGQYRLLAVAKLSGKTSRTVSHGFSVIR